MCNLRDEVMLHRFMVPVYVCQDIKARCIKYREECGGLHIRRRSGYHGRTTRWWIEIKCGYIAFSEDVVDRHDMVCVYVCMFLMECNKLVFMMIIMKSVFYMHTYLVYRMKNKCKKRVMFWMVGGGRRKTTRKKSCLNRSTAFVQYLVSFLFPSSFWCTLPLPLFFLLYKYSPSSMTSEPTAVVSFPSTSDMRVRPLAPSPASCLFQPATASCTLPSQSTHNLIPQSDDVTTIFVVGFPEDMSEREFQNMFIFSGGFEAASLKWHCKEQEDENNNNTTMNTNNGKKQMVRERERMNGENKGIFVRVTMNMMLHYYRSALLDFVQDSKLWKQSMY